MLEFCRRLKGVGAEGLRGEGFKRSADFRAGRI